MSLSAHLVEQYDTLQLPQAPFGEPVHSSQLSISGPMSFAPHMHGTFMSQPFTDTSMDQSMVSLDAPSMMSITTASAQKIAKLQATLDKKLGPEYISQRPGPGGGPKLTYAEGWKIINLANEIFGFNGWSSSVKSMMTDFVDYNQETKRYSVGVTAIIRVTLRDGAWHEDVGYGMLENGKSKGAALDKCKKEAVTDGVKRALRHFGNALGNCLYDKQYTQEVVKIKVPQTKFDKDNLHRRPEFQEGSPAGSAQTAPSPQQPPQQQCSSAVNNRPNAPLIPKAIGVNTYTSATKTASSVPAHLRNGISTPVRNGPASGLATPNQTPLSNATNQPKGKPPVHHQPVQQRSVATNTNQPRLDADPKPKAQPLKSEPTAIFNDVSNSDSRPSSGLARSDTYSFNFDEEELLKIDFDEEGRYHDGDADIGRPITAEEPEALRNELQQSNSNEQAQYHAQRMSNGNVVSEHRTRFTISANSTSAQTPVPGVNTNGISAKQQQDALANQTDEDIARQISEARQKRRAAEASPSPHGQGQQQQHQTPAANGVVQQQPPAPPGAQTHASAVKIRIPSNARAYDGSVHASAADPRSLLTAAPSGMASQNVKPRTPSMGGFSFPTGANPPQQVQAGTKRPASVFIPQKQGMANPRPGMGLSNANANGNAGSICRRPLAPLDFEGGDVKRMRM